MSVGVRASEKVDLPTRMKVHLFLNPRLREHLVKGTDFTTQDLCDELFLHLEPHDQKKLDEWWMTRKGKQFRAASLCSGADAPSRAMRDNCSTLNSRLPDSACCCFMSQQLSCDIEKYTRVFCSNNHAPMYHFHNIADVSEDNYAVEGIDIPGTYRAVPRMMIDQTVSCFSCKNVSSEFVNSSSFREPQRLGDGDGETAVTFRGTVNFMKCSSTKLGCSENVLGLGGESKRGAGAASEDDCSVYEDEDEDEYDDDWAIDLAAKRVNAELVNRTRVGSLSGLSVIARHGSYEDVLGTQEYHDDERLEQVDKREEEKEEEDLKMLSQRIQQLATTLHPNMLEVHCQFSKINCVVVHVKLNNSWFFLPADRWRWWMFYVPMLRVGLRYADVDARLDRAVRKLVALAEKVKPLMLDLDAILMKDGDPLLQAEKRKLQLRWDAALKKESTGKVHINFLVLCS